MFHKRNKLIKRLIQESSAEDVVRNHAYSRVAGKSSSVPARRTPARGQVVPGYRDSMVGSFNQYRGQASIKPSKPEAEAGDVPKHNIVGNRPASGSHDKGKMGSDHAERRHHFIEPPKRNFNRFD